MTGKKAKAHFGEVKDNRKEIDTKVNGVVTVELAAAFITIYQESNVSVSSRTERCMVRVLNIILMVENTTAIGLMTVEKDGAFINRKMATDTEENGIIIRKKDGAFIHGRAVIGTKVILRMMISMGTALFTGQMAINITANLKTMNFMAMV
jgi:hypothetical protein